MKFAVPSFLIVFASTLALAGDIPVNRIYHSKRDFHFYSPDSVAWEIINSRARNKPEDVGINDPKYCQNTGDVFVASDTELPGTFQLRQWRDRGGYEYFYSSGLPDDPKKWIESKTYDGVEPPWVWKEPGEGLVPVYCSGRPGNSDVFFTTNKKEHEAKIVYDWRAHGIKRIDLKIAFYAKPVPKDKKPKK